MTEYIKREDALNAICKACYSTDDEDYTSCECYQNKNDTFCDYKQFLLQVPSAQPTLYGYDIEHLKLIANVLQKENLPPERVNDALMDIGRIVAMVRDEFEETLRKAVGQCKI